MNGIQVFNNPAFGEIRTAGTPEGPWFCATDVCKALGYANGRDTVAKHVDEGDVAKRDTPTKNQFGTEVTLQMTYVNESGLYALILSSKLPSSKSFKKWVTSEVLPTIRKTGKYSSDVPQTFGEALMLAAKKQLEVEEQQKLIEAKDKKIAEDAPKVVFSDAVVGSKSSCLIGELAKILTQNGYKIGQNRLFDKLREEGYLGRSGEYYNIPNQKYVEQGLFELKKTTHSENGVMKSSVTPKVTGKGQQYFIYKYLKGVTTIKFDE